MISSLANAQVSNFIVFTENGERFNLIVNGIIQNSTPETNIKVTDLNADSYKIRVEFDDTSIPVMNKNVFFPTKGNEYTYTVKKNRKGEYTLRYISDVPVRQAPKPLPSQHVIVYSQTPATVQQDVVITETTTTTTSLSDNNTDGVSVNLSLGDGSMGINMNLNLDDAATNSDVTYTETTSVTTTTTSGSGDIYYDQNDAIEVHYTETCQPMSDYDFRNAKSSVSSKDFDDSKLSIAKQIVNSNCIYASQVKEIMLLLEFEENKLEFAKAAYHTTYDVQNYFVVNDAFDFESSIEELDNYIAQNR
jgi:hypothetical protein